MSGREKTPIAVFGAGGFGLEVAMLIDQINENKPQWQMVGFFDDGLPSGKKTNDWNVIGGVQELNAWQEPLAIVFALGISKVRQKVVSQITNPNIWYPTLVHPSVTIGQEKYVSIEEGAIICAGTIITTNISIGRHAIINLACTIGHEATIGDFCSFMPGCNISGEVSIGDNSFWGTGAKVINRQSIGDHTVIGAGAVVTTDIPSGATAVGVPAKIIKQNRAYLQK